jgi:hypothetical protein
VNLIVCFPNTLKIPASYSPSACVRIHTVRGPGKVEVPQSSAKLADQKCLVGSNGEYRTFILSTQYYRCHLDLLSNHLLSQIPELYMPLLTRYLSNVKGGIRDVCCLLLIGLRTAEPLTYQQNLITTCKSILSQPPPDITNPSSTLPTDSKEAKIVTEPSLKQLRARIILEALS